MSIMYFLYPRRRPEKNNFESAGFHLWQIHPYPKFPRKGSIISRKDSLCTPFVQIYGRIPLLSKGAAHRARGRSKGSPFPGRRICAAAGSPGGARRPCACRRAAGHFAQKENLRPGRRFFLWRAGRGPLYRSRPTSSSRDTSNRSANATSVGSWGYLSPYS